MKIIVGLGNPGRKYERTRHNAGFVVIDSLAKLHACEVVQEKYQAIVGACRIEDDKVLLVKPQTFMNNSGMSVGAALRGSYGDVGDLIVVHDELDLPFGTVRVKIGGGHGGHNGLRSIIEYTGSAEFVRVRFGIGRPAPGQDAAEYVLSPFFEEERSLLQEQVAQATEVVAAIVKDGPAKAMTRYNQR